MSSFLHDPNATLDYQFSWAAWLATGETITGATVVADPAGLTVAPSGKPTTFDGTSVTFWLTGGTDGATYRVTCSVTTSAGRTDDRTARVMVRHR